MSRVTLLLVFLLALTGCATTRHATGIPGDSITQSVNPASRYSGEWGKAVVRETGCVDLTGNYSIVPVPARMNANPGPLGAGENLGDLIGLQSHHWPIVYPLVEKQHVLVRGSHDYKPVDFTFYIEVEPFSSQLVNYQCIEGWIRTLNEYESGGEGGSIDYLGDAYVSKTEEGDLILFYRSWTRNTAFLGLNRFEESGDYWFLFKAQNNP